jgi:hypothetical protein
MKMLRGVRVLPDGRRVRSRTDELVPRPFLPGYLFLLLVAGDDAMLADSDHGWGKPAGVKRVLRQALDVAGRARPKLIRASIVEGIRQAALEKDETPRAPEDIRPDLRQRLDRGDEVHVRHPLGFIATLVSMDDHGRASYFAQWFGVERRGTFDNVADLELVG